jgi:hypothetical protein
MFRQYSCADTHSIFRQANCSSRNCTGLNRQYSCANTHSVFGDPATTTSHDQDHAKLLPAVLVTVTVLRNEQGVEIIDVAVSGFRDRHELVRRQALALLANLLMKDYVKWRGPLFHRCGVCRRRR